MKNAIEKLRELKRLLRGTHGAVVAYSGGVDSSLVTVVAHEVLGRRSLAVIASSALLPRRELRAALSWLERAEIPYEEVFFDALSLDVFRDNPPDRCYWCKHHLFTRFVTLARGRGFSYVLDGTNADDLFDDRPGIRALEELGISSPLAEVGLTKVEIRWLASDVYHLPQADSPSRPCLATRIPHGRAVVADELRAIEQVEDFLVRKGFGVFRARHGGDTLRLELAHSEWKDLLEDEMRQAFVGVAKEAGFRFVCFDLDGYRVGRCEGEPPSEE